MMDALAKWHLDLLEILAASGSMAVPPVTQACSWCVTERSVRPSASCASSTVAKRWVYLRDLLRDVADELAVGPPQDVRYKVVGDVLVERFRDEVANDGACNMDFPRGTCENPHDNWREYYVGEYSAKQQRRRRWKARLWSRASRTALLTRIATCHGQQCRVQKRRRRHGLAMLATLMLHMAMSLSLHMAMMATMMLPMFAPFAVIRGIAKFDTLSAWAFGRLLLRIYSCSERLATCGSMLGRCPATQACSCWTRTRKTPAGSSGRTSTTRAASSSWAEAVYSPL